MARAKTPDLIYDIGSHQGEDSEFYLRKGFRVVAVDASIEMCAVAARRLRAFLDTGQLTIENLAIAEKSGTAMLFQDSKSDWSTIVPGWRDQNVARGSSTREMIVDAITLSQLVEKHGQAIFMKIDIEGMDLTAAQSLAGVTALPQYISIESAFPRRPSFSHVKQEIETLSSLGYDRFKIVPQESVESQVPPFPPRVGVYVPFEFASGSSGLFGEEAPGRWATADAAQRAFREIRRKYWLQAMLHRRMRWYVAYQRVAFKLCGRCPSVGWYDIHAKHSSVP